MTTTGANDPEHVLTEVRQLRDRARSRAHGGVWLPVAILGVLVLSSIGLYQWPFGEPHDGTVTVPFWAGLPSAQRNPILSYAFWFVGTPVAFALIAGWYRRRATRVGFRVAWRWSVGAGLGALAALAIFAAVPVALPQDVPLGTLSAGPPPLGFVLLHGVLTPLLPIGIAIAVLGVAEASLALVVAGGWVALVAWLQSTFGVGAIFSLLEGGPGPANTARFDTPPGPLLIAVAVPLVAFAAVRAWRAHGDARW
jgi:hypothetical protein